MSFNNSTNNLFRSQKIINSAVTYVVLDDDVIINITDTTAPRAVTLPAPGATNIGKFFVVKDTSGGASSNNIIVVSTAGNIDGSANYIINTNYGNAIFYSDGTNYFVESASKEIASGIDGSVQFSENGILASNNSNLFWDNTNNRLGIGTISPTGPLDIPGFISMDSSSVALTTTPKDITSMGAPGTYFVHGKLSNGDYFNFTCWIGIRVGSTFYLVVGGCSDALASSDNQQGNLNNISITGTRTTTANIISTNESITISINNGTGHLQMLRGGATPTAAIEFRVIRFGGNF